MNNKKKLKRAFIGIIITILALIIGFVIYDRITINNQYYIGEKNLKFQFLYIIT